MGFRILGFWDFGRSKGVGSFQGVLSGVTGDIRKSQESFIGLMEF